MRRLREVRVEEGKVGRLRGYQEVKGEEGEGARIPEAEVIETLSE